MENIESAEVTDRSGRLKTFALFGLLIASLCGNVYAFLRMGRLETTLTEWRAAAGAEVAELREAIASQGAAQSRGLEAMRGEVTTTRSEALASAAKARTEAQKHADKLAQQLSTQHQETQQQVVQELSGVKESAAAANARIVEVSAEVASTKTEVSATKSDLDKTIADLKRVTGDMGVMSGLIATNGKELAALKELGERNYYEFSIRRKSEPQAVGSVRVALKKADPKRNRYTIEVHADDKRVEKRDRTTNEPVQFYLSQSRLPYEIVVNEVKKDQIVGYLAAPKVQMARK
jgi:chromosome segregation ATPase